MKNLFTYFGNIMTTTLAFFVSFSIKKEDIESFVNIMTTTLADVFYKCLFLFKKELFKSNVCVEMVTPWQ